MNGLQTHMHRVHEVPLDIVQKKSNRELARDHKKLEGLGPLKTFAIHRIPDRGHVYGRGVQSHRHLQPIQRPQNTLLYGLPRRFAEALLEAYGAVRRAVDRLSGPTHRGRQEWSPGDFVAALRTWRRRR